MMGMIYIDCMAYVSVYKWAVCEKERIYNSEELNGMNHDHEGTNITPESKKKKEKSTRGRSVVNQSVDIG